VSLSKFSSHIWLAKNHIASYESKMALILVDIIAKQIPRELGVDKVGSSKIFSIPLSPMQSVTLKLL
jgi:hypothetical protein